MSLINDTLRDLERRQAGTPAGTRAPAPPARRRSGWLWLFAIAAVAGIALHFVLGHLSGPDARSDLPMQAQVPPIEPVSPPTGPAEPAGAAVSGGNEHTTPDEPPEQMVTVLDPGELAPPAAEPEPQPPAPAERQVAVIDTPARAAPETSQPSASADTAPEDETGQEIRIRRADGDGADAEPDSGIRIQRAGEEAASDTDDQAFESARRALAREQFNTAERRIRRLLENDPAHDEARMLLANRLIERGELRRAAHLLEEGLEASHEPEVLAALLGRLLIERDESTRARRLLAEHAPDPMADPDYHQLLAAAHRQSGDHDAALESYRQLAEVVPERGAVWIGLGASLEALDRPDEAYQAYERALEVSDRRAAQFARQRLDVLGNDHGERR